MYSKVIRIYLLKYSKVNQTAMVLNTEFLVNIPIYGGEDGHGVQEIVEVFKGVGDDGDGSYVDVD